LCCEAVPMMIYLLGLFGFMDFLILYKWVTPWAQGTESSPAAPAPQIINSMIASVMRGPDDAPFWAGFHAQTIWVVIAVGISVPLMLLPKPFLLKYKFNQAKKNKATDLDEEQQALIAEEDEEEFEMGEAVIHQVIETIEYVLGVISHTVSYLRVWALSLAHARLSDVIGGDTLEIGWGMCKNGNWLVGGIALYLLFGIWFAATSGILMAMDWLECVLHTLRLHWVEFQSKFYKAEGNDFKPFSIKDVVVSAYEA